MKNLLISVLSLVIVVSTIPLSHSASFECTKAKSKVEKLICSNHSLSNLDEDLKDVYQKKLATIINTGLNPIALIDDQRAWVKLIRNTCVDLNCLTHVYTERIKDIQNFSALDHVPMTNIPKYLMPEVNDSLTLICDYENSESPGKESIYISQQPVEQKNLKYVDSFKKGEKKSQHMRFDVSGGSASCEFPSGKSVKVKIGEGIARAYGECGGSPEIFASIWIDQKKVISRRWFAGHCAELRDMPLFSLKISNDKASECLTTQSTFSKGKVTKPTTSCTLINNIQKLPIDTIEYPLAGTNPRPVGSVEIVNGKDPLCQSIASNRDIANAFSDYASYKQNEASIKLPEAFEGSTESVYDFNNDGNLDRVFTKEFESSYMQGNALIIQFGKSSKKLDLDKGSLLTENSMIAACQLDSKKYKIEDCSPPSQKADDAGFEMRGRPEEPAVYFRARYSTLYPFRYENSNYVGVDSYSQDTMNYIAVIKPLPNRGFEQTCLVRQVPENY